MHRWALPLFGFSLVACGGLAAIDQTSLHEANQLDELIYNSTDGGPDGSPIRAFARGSYCATAAVLRRNDAGAPASVDGGIQCQTY